MSDRPQHRTTSSSATLSSERLRGSIPPLVTPFKQGEVDYDAYARLVNLQIEQGSHGILVNGTTAEPSTLTLTERNRLVSLAIETAAGRVPVVAATGSQSLAESRVLTEHADYGRRRRAIDRHALLHPAAAARTRAPTTSSWHADTTCRGWSTTSPDAPPSA